MRLRVYADREHYSGHHRKALNDILKALWNSSSPAERRAIYGNRDELFEAVDHADEADLHLLPMRWQYYVDHDLVDLAMRAVDAARRARKPIAIFSLGDFEANVPIAGDDIHVFQAAGYRSRRRAGNHGMPAFIDDPRPGFSNGELTLRSKGTKPVVGFCGQAGSSLLTHGARWVRTQWRRGRWWLGQERWEPAPLEHTWFRQRALDTFARSSHVETRYVLRAKYRAGVHSADRNDPAQHARREFLENVDDTDYTICVRGGGNYSVRFYEALAMGRIPIFIDTDCVLPFHDIVDWRQYTIWVDERELGDAPQIAARAHARMSPAEFRERQQACRRLWLERLTPDGFYAHFREHFPELA